MSEWYWSFPPGTEELPNFFDCNWKMQQHCKRGLYCPQTRWTNVWCCFVVLPESGDPGNPKQVITDPWRVN